MSTKSARTTNMKMIVCDPEAEAGSHHCWPSTNIQTHRGGAQLLPRHTTCSRSHKLLVSSQTNYLPSSLSTQGLLISCASWGLSPPTFTRTRKPSIMQKLVRLSQGNHEINWRLDGGVYSLSWILSCSTSRPGHTCVTAPRTPMCHPSSTTSLTSSLAISSVRTKSYKGSWRRNWISRVKSTSPLPWSFLSSTRRTSRESALYPHVLHYYWRSPWRQDSGGHHGRFDKGFGDGIHITNFSKGHSHQPWPCGCTQVCCVRFVLGTLVWGAPAQYGHCRDWWGQEIRCVHWHQRLNEDVNAFFWINETHYLQCLLLSLVCWLWDSIWMIVTLILARCFSSLFSSLYTYT